MNNVRFVSAKNPLTAANSYEDDNMLSIFIIGCVFNRTILAG